MAADFEKIAEAFAAKQRAKNKQHEIKREQYRAVLKEFKELQGASGSVTQDKVDRREKAKKTQKTLATIHENDKIVADLASFVDLPDLEVK
jgi:hypothetical protein